MPVKFYSIHPVYDGNGRKYKKSFSNDDKTSKLIDRKKIKKLVIKINIYFIKYSMITKNINIEIKWEIDGRIYLYSSCIDSCFK